MTNAEEFHWLVCIRKPRTRTVTFAATIFALCLLVGLSAHAQTFQVIHTFIGIPDGGQPTALLIDRNGNLYGTAAIGGSNFFGTVFQLRRAHSEWSLNVLYNLQGYDGSLPVGITFGPAGTLFGTTTNGGAGRGLVFKLEPPISVCRDVTCTWNETVLYQFQGGADGQFPESGVFLDGSGALYGTTYQGGNGGQNCGSAGCGTVYKLTPSNGSWQESVLYSFRSGRDGGYPWAGVLVNESGIFGTTALGGQFNTGTIYQLKASGNGWTKTTLYDFGRMATNGAEPFAGLIPGAAGNLYGATSIKGPNGGGTAFELMPSNGSWSISQLYAFSGPNDYPPAGPAANLLMDNTGNLYGTTNRGGIGCAPYGCGTVFKLAPSNGTWSYTLLHNFSGGADGENPQSNVVLDRNGNLYGTASAGGANNVGVVWEITP